MKESEKVENSGPGEEPDKMESTNKKRSASATLGMTLPRKRIHRTCAPSESPGIETF